MRKIIILFNMKIKSEKISSFLIMKVKSEKSIKEKSNKNKI